MRMLCALGAIAGLGSAAVAQDSPPEMQGPEIHSVAQDATVRFRAAAWITGAKGSMNVGTDFPGTISDIELEDTLGLDTDQTVVWAVLGFNLGPERRWRLDLGYSGHFEYEGTSDPISISFNDRIFSGVIESRAELDIYEANLRYDLVQTGPFALSIGPGARVFDFEASIEGMASEPPGGTSEFRVEDEQAIVPLPAMGVGVRWELTPNLYLRGSVSGIYAGGYGNFFDTAAEVGWDPWANVGLFGGWRFMHAEADVEDVEFDIDLQGPFVGAEIRF